MTKDNHEYTILSVTVHLSYRPGGERWLKQVQKEDHPDTNAICTGDLTFKKTNNGTEGPSYWEVELIGNASQATKTNLERDGWVQSTA